MNNSTPRFAKPTTSFTMPVSPAPSPRLARGPSRRSRRRRAGADAGLALALAAAAILGAAPFGEAAGPKVWVTTAVELQQQVHDSINAGKTIVLAPGVYMLDPAGPTLGRLELQTDMELEGVPGNNAAVVIDASRLDATLPGAPDPAVPASYQDGTLFTGALRVGRGHNAVRWMTLRRAGLGAAFIEADLPPVAGAETSVTVEHCSIEGNIRAIDFRLVGAAANGRTMTGDFRDNVLRSNTLGMGQGLRIVFLQGANDATLRATIQGNTFAANLAGIFAGSNGSSRNTITVDSRNNSFTGNGVGAVLVAGLTSGARAADDNAVTFGSQDDEFDGNLLPTTVYTAAGAGLAVSGADSTSTTAGKTNRNSATVELRNAHFLDNPAGDLLTVGAHGANGLVAGTHNEVLVTLLGSTADLDIPTPVESDPAEPTNHVTIVGHPGQ
jgi:hypothetical protein